MAGAQHDRRVLVVIASLRSSTHNLCTNNVLRPRSLDPLALQIHVWSLIIFHFSPQRPHHPNPPDSSTHFQTPSSMADRHSSSRKPTIRARDPTALVRQSELQGVILDVENARRELDSVSQISSETAKLVRRTNDSLVALHELCKKELVY